MVSHNVQSISSRIAPLPDFAPLQNLVTHLRDHSSTLRHAWLRRIEGARLLSAMGGDGVSAELASIYDHHVNVIGGGNAEALIASGRHVRERIAPRGIEAAEMVGVMLLLREVVVQSLITVYDEDRSALHRMVSAYEGMAHLVAIGVVMACLQDREQLIEMQREAVRELSAPVLQLRDRLLLLPVVGPVDVARVTQMTAELLQAIRLRRAKVVLLDVAGVPAMDTAVATHLSQASDAARLLGAVFILSGLSSTVAQALVTRGVSFDRITTVGDLQAGLEVAEHLLGYRSAPAVERLTDTAQEHG